MRKTILAECLGAMNYQADTNSDGDSDSEDSMDDLLCKVYNRCLDLAYMPNLMTPRNQSVGMPDRMWNEVCCYVDKLHHKRIYNILEGRCSLNDSLAFDLESEENKLKKDLEDFNKYTPC